jgi:putative AlgH/UPF0301 family transcriptional regulator
MNYFRFLLLCCYYSATSFHLPFISGLYPIRGCRLSMSSDIPSQSEPSIKEITPAKFTGAGCVLLSQPNERDPELYHAAVFIFSHQPTKGSSGVVLDFPAPFTGEKTIMGFPEFATNRLWKGGHQGGDFAIVLHKHKEVNLSKHVGNGIYLGGVGHIAEMIKNQQLAPSEFKIMFSSLEWGKYQLEVEIEQKRWDVCHIPVEQVLDQEIYKDRKLWIRCRRKLREANALHNPQD